MPFRSDSSGFPVLRDNRDLIAMTAVVVIGQSTRSCFENEPEQSRPNSAPVSRGSLLRGHSLALGPAKLHQSARAHLLHGKEIFLLCIALQQFLNYYSFL